MSKAKKHLRPVVSSINDNPDTRDMLKMLRTFMKEVRKGEVTELAVCAVMKGGDSATDYVNLGGPALPGALFRAAQEITFDELMAEAEDDDAPDVDDEGDEDEDEDEEDGEAPEAPVGG